MPAPVPLPTYIYKIVPHDPRPLTNGLPVSELDRKDGFVHMSTAEQTPNTVGRFFKDAEVVYLLKVPYTRVQTKIQWEEAGSGTFPHIYDGDLSKAIDDTVVDAVLECRRAESGGWDGIVEKVISESA